MQKSSNQKNIDVIKMHHYAGLRHAKTLINSLIESKEQSGTLDALNGKEALKMALAEIQKTMQEMRGL